MFHTIVHKSGGWVQVSYNPSQRIAAWSHGDMLGDHYRSVAGAMSAITRHHKKWVSSRDFEHRGFMRECGFLK